MKLTPVHCCIIWREVPRIVRRRLDFWSVSPPEKQFIQLENQPVDGISCRSYSSLATISASSTLTYSESLGWPRRRASASVAASRFPFLTKYRGESGRKRRPPPRMMAHANWMPMGILYAPVSVRFFVAYTTTEASKIPIVIQN